MYKKMYKKLMDNFWGAFVFIVFLIISSTAFIIGIIIWLISSLGIDKPVRHYPLVPYMFTLLFSVLVGTVISIFVGKIILEPVRKLSIAMRQVSEGNFNIHVEYDKDNVVGQLTNDFNKMVHELNSIETLRNDFVTNVSHEIKTPVASIEGCAAILQDESLSDHERKEYTDLIVVSSHRLSKLTSNVLKLSKLENQEIIPDKRIYLIDEQIRQSILGLESVWTAKDIDFNLELPAVDYYGSEELMMHAWNNLVGNAIKFSNDGAKISVVLEDQKDSIMVTVSDEGIGMSEETVKHIYDKFYQGDTAHSMEGNGLGMALVKRIVDLNLGRIEIKSQIGKGSEISVILPNVAKQEKNRLEQ